MKRLKKDENLQIKLLKQIRKPMPRPAFIIIDLKKKAKRLRNNKIKESENE